jgi:DNA sulfur modification protein DndD
MDIDLRLNGRIPRVALVQMPNGTGKTTTLALLKATLTGEAKDWPRGRVQQLRQPGTATESGRFSVELRLDERPLKLELLVDFETGAVSYATTSPDVGGFNNAWAPPASARRFLTRRFVELFIFDGELANSLLDPKVARAEEAIETLCQLDLLDGVQSDIDAYWERATAKAGPTTEKGLSRYQTIASRLVARLSFLQQSALSTTQRLKSVEDEIAKLTDSITKRIEEDEKNRDLWVKRTVAKASKEEELSAALRSLMEKMRRPEALSEAFGRALSSIKSNLDRVKLPDSTSRQFFTELSQEALCICGRPIGEHEKSVILTRADDFLGEELAGVLNSLKHDVDILSPSESRAALEENIARLQQVRVDIGLLETEIAQITKTSLVAAGENPDDIRAKMEKMRDEERKLREHLDVFNGPAPASANLLMTNASEAEDILVIATAQKQLKLANDEINRINGTLELRRRIDTLKAVCADAQRIARTRLKATLVDRCNARLKMVLRGDPLSISRIDRSLILRDRASGSAGQNLAVGYTFLAEALKKGAHNFPLVVDSPAGPLDHPVRREIGAMIPQLCNQFVAFTISTERAAFLEPLERAADAEVKYLTVFRKTDGNAALLDDVPGDAVDNGQSVLVTGRDYFVKFALIEESELKGPQ